MMSQFEEASVLVGSTESSHTPLHCLVQFPDLNDSLKKVLPDGHFYVFTQYEEQQLENFSGAPEQALSCTVLDVKTKEEALDWLQSFSAKPKQLSA